MLNRSPRLPFRLKRLHPLHRPWSNRHRSRCLRLQQTRRQHPPACATFWLNYPPDPIAEEVAEQLPVLTREIDARLRETRKIVAQRASLEILVGLESEWRRLRRNLSGWTRDLTNRATWLEHQIAELDQLEKTWEQTLDAAKSSNTPPQVLHRIEAVIAQIGQAREAVKKQRARVLTPQNRVAGQEARIADALRLIRQAREDVLNRLFVKDSPTIWSTEVRSHAPQDLLEETRTSFLHTMDDPACLR
jgi:hypothetical protein